jgi:hypothetical protein
VLRPTGLLGVIGVTQIFVRSRRACGRVTDGSLICWGNIDARGHFATGADGVPTYRIPTPVVGLDHLAGLVDGGAFADDGRMWRFASDGAPVRLDAEGVEEIAERDGALCGRLSTGRVICAASDRCGTRHAASPAKPTDTKPSAGRAGAKPAAAPARSAAAAPVGEPVDTLGITAAHQLAFDIGFCAVTTANKLQCGDGCRHTEPAKLQRIASVAGRCVQFRSGAVSCFHGRTTAAAPSLSGGKLLAAGRAHACAMIDNQIVCWGDDSHHQLGELSSLRESR